MKQKQVVGLEYIKKREKELLKKYSSKELAREMADLENDFEHIKELNTELAEKYQTVMDTFPTSRELSFLIKHISDFKATVNKIENREDALLYEKKQCNERLFKLNQFLGILKALEKQNINVLPQKYDELEKDKK